MDATTTGVPQTAFVADAARQNEYVTAFFYTLGDLFGGSDSSPRIPTTYGQTTDIGVDAAGVPYVRGSSSALPSPTATNGTAAGQSTFQITPGMWIAGGLALWLILKKRGK